MQAIRCLWVERSDICNIMLGSLCQSTYRYIVPSCCLANAEKQEGLESCDTASHLFPMLHQMIKSGMLHCQLEPCNPPAQVACDFRVACLPAALHFTFVNKDAQRRDGWVKLQNHAEEHILHSWIPISCASLQTSCSLPTHLELNM